MSTISVVVVVLVVNLRVHHGGVHTGVRAQASAREGRLESIDIALRDVSSNMITFVMLSYRIFHVLRGVRMHVILLLL